MRHSFLSIGSVLLASLSVAATTSAASTTSSTSDSSTTSASLSSSITSSACSNAIPSACAAQPVINGGFDETLDPWVPLTNSADSSYSSSFGHDAPGSVLLSSFFKTTAGVSQAISNICVGSTYTVSFWYYITNTPSGGYGNYMWAGVEDAYSTWLVNNVKNTWIQGSINFIANADSATFTLKLQESPSALGYMIGYVDDITVSTTIPNICPCAVAPSQLLQNSGFESGDISPWISDTTVVEENFVNSPSHTGDWESYLTASYSSYDGNQQDGVIRQTLTGLLRQPYSFSLWYHAYTVSNECYTQQTPCHLSVTLGYDDETAIISDDIVAQTSTDSYIQLTGSFTPISWTLDLTITLTCLPVDDLDSCANDGVFVDDITFTRNDIPALPDYCSVSPSSTIESTTTNYTSISIEETPTSTSTLSTETSTGVTSEVYSSPSSSETLTSFGSLTSSTGESTTSTTSLSSATTIVSSIITSTTISETPTSTSTSSTETSTGLTSLSTEASTTSTTSFTPATITASSGITSTATSEISPTTRTTSESSSIIASTSAIALATSETPTRTRTTSESSLIAASSSANTLATVTGVSPSISSETSTFSAISSSITFPSTTGSSSTTDISSVTATTSPSISTAATSLEMTTSTAYTTTTYTITSCASTVTNCPIGSVTTEIIALYTTVCPIAKLRSSASSPSPVSIAAQSAAVSGSLGAVVTAVSSSPKFSNVSAVVAILPSSPVAGAGTTSSTPSHTLPSASRASGGSAFSAETFSTSGLIKPATTVGPVLSNSGNKIGSTGIGMVILIILLI